jgi:hypothetical protein
MVYKRFLGLALGLLFVMNAIWGSCAYDYHGIYISCHLLSFDGKKTLLEFILSLFDFVL